MNPAIVFDLVFRRLAVLLEKVNNYINVAAYNLQRAAH